MGSRQPNLCQDCAAHWLKHNRKSNVRCLAFDPEHECPEYNDKLNQIARALEEYHAALRRREHGDLAAWKFVDRCEDILKEKNIEPERVGYTLVPGVKKFIAEESANGKSIYEQSVKSWDVKCSYHFWLYLFETTIEDSKPEITFEQWQDIRKQFGLSYRDEE